MHRSFVHLELNTGDTDAARAFYRQVFQWDFEDIPMVDGSRYTQIRPPTGLMGGMQAKVGPNAPTAWMPYVGVESVEDTVARVVAAGGVVVEPYQPVPGFGALAIVEDPTGATFGLWETAMPMPAEDAASGGEAADDGEREAAPAEPAPPPRAKKTAKKTAKTAAPEPVKTSTKKTAEPAKPVKPSTKKTAKKTAEPPKAAKKTAKKAAEKPAKKSSTKKPAKKSSTKKPAKKPSTKKPAKSPGRGKKGAR